MNIIRSILFNIVYYGSTAVLCFVYVPTVLLPKDLYIKALNAYFHYVAFIEKHILGLTYKVEGIENLPKSGAYIIAAKHQSSYETLKLYLLFKDPAVILKKELFSIPLWGWLAKKAGHIGIDRTNRQTAVESINEGAKRVASEGRPIVIFPQGTRVRVGDKKPYKKGVAHMAVAADLPIIPLALNSGQYWGKNAFWKKSGVVTFKFLPPIPKGTSTKDIMDILENDLENESTKLIK
ncbi:MAG: lysophospholipid acyltransferase family protein [Bdellovibrionales bacterium]